MGYRDFIYVYPPNESSKIQYDIFVSVGRDISEILFFL